MRLSVVTLFPELFTPFLDTSFVGRARKSGALEVHLEALREQGLGAHRSVDDTPYGGGSGMVMRVDCVVAALESSESTSGRSHRVLLTPQGAPFEQARAERLAQREAIALVCGRYEGVDERVRQHVDEEISIGDYLLTGGEVAAMAVIEAVVRLLPGVLGNRESAAVESFSAACEGLLEYPQYTRPATFRGEGVPEVLRSGDHAKIEAWRKEQSRQRTADRRPDLLRHGEPDS